MYISPTSPLLNFGEDSLNRIFHKLMTTIFNILNFIFYLKIIFGKTKQIIVL